MATNYLTAGINEIIYHGFPYEYMDRPEPGLAPVLLALRSRETLTRRT